MGEMMRHFVGFARKKNLPHLQTTRVGFGSPIRSLFSLTPSLFRLLLEDVVLP